MNRLEQNHVTAISSSFYKNVFLLTQAVPPSFQFQQHFRKDMFDKPNTAGFLYVSHYLSIIYNANLFKQMVKWPILCKKDEATYRIEMKNFFCILLQDNPDIKFPSILMSHLIQSSGTKFLTFMWKLSQLVLRTYIKGELQGELLNAPHTGPMDDLTITYLDNINTEMCSIIANAQKETKSILDAANSFMKDEIETLNMYKMEIFERRKMIKKLVSNVHPLIQKELIDVENSNFINLWKIDILEKLQNVHKKNKKLNKFEESCNHLHKIVLRIKSNSEILDANQFPKINCDYYSLHSQFYLQDGSLAFSTLLSLLHMRLIQMLCHINGDFSDMSPCLLYIQNNCEIIKYLRMLFVELNMKVDDMLNNEQCVSQKIEDVCIDFNIDNLPIINQDTFRLLQSPNKTNFNFNRYTDDNLFHERLCSPLTEGKHKDLFKRYKRKHCPYELPTITLDFTNSWNNMNGWLSPRAYSTKYKYTCNGKPLSPLYSRLLHNSKLKPKHSRENIAHSVGYEALNLTPRKRRSTSDHLTMKTLGKKMRDVFNSAIVLSSSRAFLDEMSTPFKSMLLQLLDVFFFFYLTVRR